ncbi:MAG: glycosyltransferase 87 family protein, partial [Candidatus Eremiobacteraeota bacterium]|nr:glycosyltransferase 87 family protein [Candidatus Eremiobacteraeota bacterium]
PFIGPPAFLPLWVVFAKLPFTVAAAVWGCILIASAFAFAVATLRAAAALSVGALLSTAILLTGFGPFTSDVALGQCALLAFVACTGASMWIGHSRPAAIVAVLAAALQPNVAIALLSQGSRKRAWPVFAGALAIFAILGMFFTGGNAAAYVRGLVEHGQAERFALIQITPAAIAYGFGLGSFIAQIIGILVALCAAAVGAGVVRMAHVKPLWKLAACCALLPFAVPFFHEHDFVVLLLPALLCVTVAEGRAWSVAAAGTLLCAIDWLGLAQRPEGLLQSALLSLAALAAIFALVEVQPQRLIGAACVFVTLVIAGAIAGHMPAPIWPDAMTGSISLSGPAAHIWHRELAQTGQFAINPFWALLRSFTLAGAAALAWATISTARRRDQLEMS